MQILHSHQQKDGDQAQRNRNRVFPPKNGPLYYAALLKIKNHYGKLQAITASHMRQSGELFVRRGNRQQDKSLSLVFLALFPLPLSLTEAVTRSVSGWGVANLMSSAVTKSPSK